VAALAPTQLRAYLLFLRAQLQEADCKRASWTSRRCYRNTQTTTHCGLIFCESGRRHSKLWDTSFCGSTAV